MVLEGQKEVHVEDHGQGPLEDHIEVRLEDHAEARLEDHAEVPVEENGEGPREDHAEVPLEVIEDHGDLAPLLLPSSPDNEASVLW